MCRPSGFDASRPVVRAARAAAAAVYSKDNACGGRPSWTFRRRTDENRSKASIFAPQRTNALNATKRRLKAGRPRTDCSGRGGNASPGERSSEYRRSSKHAGTPTYLPPTPGRQHNSHSPPLCARPAEGAPRAASITRTPSAASRQHRNAAARCHRKRHRP